MNVSMRLASALVLATALAAGCLDRDLPPITPCTVSGVVYTVTQSQIENVDVLFVIDNSGSMAEEQASLSVQIPRLATALATGDADGDGTPDFPAVKSLHLGVVSTDMGNAGFALPTCATTFGDDGVLVTRGNTSDASCSASYPSFVTFAPGGDASQFGDDVHCVSRLGTAGCGFEQQLEAALKALTPSTSPIAFSMGTVGHGDRENAGFLREDSLLAVVIVTDEEDCSVADPDLLNVSSTTYTGDLNLRCFQHPEAAHPISRFVEGFRALRADDPNLFVLAALTGVPTDLVADREHVDFDAILADERMQEVIDTRAGAPRLRPSCNVPGRGLAFPPRRIVQVAQQFAPNAVVQSICQDDFGPALDAILWRLSITLSAVCLPRALAPDARGMVTCDVVEVLPAGRRCDELDGRTLRRTSEPARGEPAGREVCQVAQVPDRSAPGWYYDDAPGDVCPARAAQRVSYVPGSEPMRKTVVRLECLQPVQSVAAVAPSEVVIGTPCAADPSVCARGGMPLRCDGATARCQLPCTSDASCHAEGLPGFRCDTRDPAGAYCVNPTCGS